jgi:hypothetical protein
VRPPWRIQVLPISEYRNSLAYSQYDVLGNYAGIPNNTRFSNFFSADARVVKDIKVSPKVWNVFWEPPRGLRCDLLR